MYMYCALKILWENERKESGETRRQTFLDLGCGNGLLVYLLSSEGVCMYKKALAIHWFLS